ncbi:TetR/AcrR family transcriptional regulator [Nocardia sp. A7]|uniref:TetR/AcrR family transcriptional regulator n=1 Tax=Nocardia sp. A7 TaxID=2789274 RepID=UPI00397B5926
MSTPRTGRPRLVGQRRPGETPEEEILDAAAELFTRNGFAGTPTRTIADAVGIRQSTIYHYFATKEDILDNLLTRTVAEPALLAEALMAGSEPAAVRLYAMTWYDCRQLLVSKWNLGALFNLPESKRTQFPRFEERREYLRDCYRELSAQARTEFGTQDSPEGTTDVNIAVALPFHLVETVIQIRSDRPQWVDQVGAESLATGIADTVARTLGRTGDLTTLREAAHQAVRRRLDRLP